MKLEKRSANGQNIAGWASLWALREGDTKPLKKLGTRGGRESSRMRTLRARARITNAMRSEAACLEALDAYHSGFKTVDEYKHH